LRRAHLALAYLIEQETTMQLWTEYEGITIDGAFPLKKLLLPEGRSAFFSTANGKGEPVFLRLIECHFDEEEILSRWRAAEAFDHPNFLKLERYGQLLLDDATVVYAVFEKVDASLAQAVKQGRLSVVETTQLATSLASALDMLHTNGFIHGHVEPRNIFAVGDVVKLRSDCIREAPEGEAGLAAKRRDVHDFAVVLLEALTQRQTLDAAMKVRALPAPLSEIVQNGMSGAWNFAEIYAVLRTAQPAAHPFSSAPAVTPSAPRPVVDSTDRPWAAPAAATPTPAVSTKPLSASRPLNTGSSTIRQQVSPKSRREELSLQKRWIGTVAFIMLLSLLVGWGFVHDWHGADKSASAAATATPASTAPVAKRVVSTPVQTNTGAAVRPAADHEAASRLNWRVVAYTYNRQDQAQKKAATIAQQHPELRPQVFTPTGHAPYLVTIGGVMARDQAYSLARKSRGSGLPRDTYAQNYNVAMR
jgi:hypothetical protein